MKPNFDNCSDIKGLRFFAKEICPHYIPLILHTKKDSGGASIHRVNESFPLKPSLGPFLKVPFLKVSLLFLNLNSV